MNAGSKWVAMSLVLMAVIAGTLEVSAESRNAGQIDQAYAHQGQLGGNGADSYSFTVRQGAWYKIDVFTGLHFPKNPERLAAS